MAIKNSTGVLRNTSEGAKKAWASRQRAASAQPSPGQTFIRKPTLKQINHETMRIQAFGSRHGYGTSKLNNVIMQRAKAIGSQQKLHSFSQALEQENMPDLSGRVRKMMIKRYGKR